MAELIDKKNLFNSLFVRNGKVCPNSDIDNFPTTIDVKEVKKAILEQPTTTEAELRASVIEEAISKLLPYGSLCVEWNDGMGKEEIATSVLNQAKEQFIDVLERMKGEKE